MNFERMTKRLITTLTILGLFGFTTSGTEKWLELKDDQKIDDYYRKDNQIFCGDVVCKVKPMQGVDIATFKVRPGSKYAKDKTNVYYPLQVVCVDYTDCGVCYCTKFVVAYADSKTFDYLDKDYAIDDNSVFFRGEEIKTADPMTFKVIKGGEYFYFAVDSKAVYRHNQIFKEADPATFYYDSLNSANNEWTYIIGDKNGKWKFTPPGQIERFKN